MEPYLVSAFGPLTVAISPGDPLRLTPARRSTLARLVAAGPAGLDSAEFLGESRPDTTGERAKVRTAISRLRASGIPEDWLVTDPGPRYRLALAPSEVDVWHLAALAQGGGIPHIEVAARVLGTAVPFSDVESAPLIDRAAEHVRRHQSALLARMSDEVPELLTRYTDTLIELRHAEPFDERLIALTVTAMLSAGRQRDALTVIRDAHREFADFGLQVSVDIRDLEQQILNGDHSIRSNSVIPRIPGERRLPVVLRSRLEGERVGNVAAIERLVELLGPNSDGPPSAVVSGPSGAGKSRLAAEAAQVALDRGWALVAVVAHERGADIPYASFLTGISENNGPDLLKDLVDGSLDERRLQHWAAIARALDEIAGGRPLLLVVDDAQWLDGYSAAFLEHIAASGSTSLRAVYIVGRDDGSELAGSRWRSVVAAARNDGAVTVAAEPFDVERMRAFVRSRRPGLRRPVADRLATDLLDASAGLPGVAVLLLASVGDELPVLISDAARLGRSPLTSLAGTMDPAQRDVAGAIGVIGPQFSSIDLADVLLAVDGTDDAGFLDHLEEFVDRELLIRSGEHNYALAHVLIHRVFLDLASPARSASLHLAAAEVFAADERRRANHLWRAMPMCSFEEAAAAMLASARASLTSGAHTEAVEQFERVAAEPRARLSVDDRAAWSRALDMRGITDRARSIRHEAFALAVAAEDWLGAFTAATSGLPEAESFDGDADLLRQLRLIPATELDDDRAWAHSLHVARQSALLGDVEMVRIGAAAAWKRASTPHRRVAAAICERWATNMERPQARLDVLDRVLDDLPAADPEIASEFVVNRSIDLWEAGRTVEAEQALAAVRDRERLSDRRRWLMCLLESMFASEREEPNAADRRREAYELGTLVGASDADKALLVSEFIETWIRDEHIVFAALLETGEIDPGQNLLTRAAAAAVRWAAGQQESAMAMALEVATGAAGSSLVAGAPAIALVSDILAHDPASTHALAAADVLRRRGSSLIVVGAGAGCVGPAERYLARLSPSTEHAVALLRSAVTFSETAGLDRWRSACVADLNRLIGIDSTRELLTS